MMNDECRMKCGPTGPAVRRRSPRPPFSIQHSAFGTPLRRAFTLLELVVVMLVLSVLFAMAAPSMSGFGAGREAQQTASQIVTLARWAREQAISEGRTYRLNFDTTQQNYFVTSAYGATFQQQQLGVDFGRPFSIPPGVQLIFEAPQENGLPYLEFLPTGRCGPAHVQVISRDEQVTDLASLSATEPLRVVTPDELREATLQ